jgi:iron complex outermembrane receptor protein
VSARSALWLGVALAVLASAAAAETVDSASPPLPDLDQMSIEDLANLEVTSVSRKPESVSGAAAAIYVINGEAIRRSGALNLPEALRLAPNLQVAANDSSTFAISARGFNHSTSTANKLQVLVDGRTVYTPLFSGVFWDVQNVFMEDLDRIEVISGPGGTLWGANAVNGVINVTSRAASETQGGFLTVGGGTAFTSLRARYGGGLGPGGAWRVYALYDQRGPSARPSGLEAFDQNDILQGGFRADWGTGRDGFTLQGDVYAGSAERAPSAAVAPTVSGGNLLGRWTRTASGGAVLEVQAYLDHTARTASSRVASSIDTADLALQYRLASRGAHDITFGGGHRIADDRFTPRPGTAYLAPAGRTQAWTNAYVQDEIRLGPTVRLTLGVKVEKNSYTGVEAMPSGRLVWQPSDRTMLWGAVSRAVRIPARFDRDLYNGVILAGGPDFESERLTAYEIGYRGRPTAALSLSISAFFNDYDDLRTVEATPLTVFPLVVRNGMEGSTQGVEAWADLAINPRWRISAGLSTLRKDLHLKPGSADVFGIAYAGNDPERQAQLRTSIDLTRSLQFDATLRAVDDLASPAVPGYVEADARLAWRISDATELSVSGANLLHSQHLEFVNSALPRREIRRTVFVALRRVF